MLARKDWTQLAFTYAMTFLLLGVYGLVVLQVMPGGAPAWATPAFVLTLLLLPPPLCFLLVRTYTQMIEDERINALGEAWARCEAEFWGSEEAEEAQRQIKEGADLTDDGRTRIFLECLRHFILRRHPTVTRLFVKLREDPTKNGKAFFSDDRVMEVARRLAKSEIRTAGLHREAYHLPILFFALAYLAGIPLVFPLLEASGPRFFSNLTLAQNVTVPLMVFQVGFLGGLAFAAYNLISRFLSHDIAPRLFLVSGVRLVLAPLGAAALYLLTPESAAVPFMALDLPIRDSGAAIAIYLAAGGFPFALLQTLWSDLLSRLDPFKQRLTAGKRSITLVEGITIFTAQRLSEEGIEVIQHLAFCDPTDLARRTRYSESTVADWKDQAILYLLTGDCTVPGTPPPDPPKPSPVLYDLLDQRAGIRTASGLIRRIWVGGGTDPQGGPRANGLHVRPDIEPFLHELGLLAQRDEIERKRQFEAMVFLFSRLCEDGLAIEPGLRRVRRPGRAPVTPPLAAPARVAS